MIHSIHPMLLGVHHGCLRWEPRRNWAAPALCPALSVPGGQLCSTEQLPGLFPLTERGSQGPTQKAVLASMGRKPLMRQREGVLHSWLVAGWGLLF